MNWEYREETIRGPGMLDKCRQLGAEGWELCGLWTCYGCTHMIFKRQA